MTTKVLRSAAIKIKTPSKTVLPKTNTAQLICKLTIEAHQQTHVSLGTFTERRPLRGFSIHLKPDPEPDSIIAQTTRLDSEGEYELILHIANYGNQVTNAEVWPL